MSRAFTRALAVVWLACSPALAFASSPAAPETVSLAVAGDMERELPVSIWTPASEPRAVALFSHGYNSWPAAYDVLIDRLIGEGFAVVAPLHLDSLRSKLEGRIPPEQGFASRLGDMAAASDLVRERFAGLPVLEVGHSFGTLVALTRAGGLPGIAPSADEPASAILAFSSPGRIPGLTGPDAFSEVTVPVLLVTGGKDVVPGFVADPADHRVYAERPQGPAYVVSLAEADHDLVGDEARIDAVWEAVEAFIVAHVLGEGHARQDIDQWAVTRPDEETER